jgi:23S rRNA (adenine1618-N6)-methyltransferase
VIRPGVKERLHPRSRFRGGYDFARLVEAFPALSSFVAPNAHGDDSVDFADPAAVKVLNQALLKSACALEAWDVPAGYLCPPIPGRSDYLHYLADLLGVDASRPRGSVAVVDIGMGASCIYPLLGAVEYGWRFVGTDIDPVAVAWAEKTVRANRAVADLIECRLQSSPRQCFDGVVRPGERFDASMCNPPFHVSAAAAAEGSLRKRRHLGARAPRETPLNFGGRPGELWCEGGEVGFVRRMILESAARPHVCRWFTSLVSKSTHLPALRHTLRQVHPVDTRVIEMSHGQKQSRIVAWTFAEEPR